MTTKKRKEWKPNLDFCMTDFHERQRQIDKKICDDLKESGIELKPIEIVGERKPVLMV